MLCQERDGRNVWCLEKGARDGKEAIGMEVEVMDDEDAGAIERCGSVNTSESNWSIQSSLDGAEIHAGGIQDSTVVNHTCPAMQEEVRRYRVDNGAH